MYVGSQDESMIGRNLDRRLQKCTLPLNEIYDYWQNVLWIYCILTKEW